MIDLSVITATLAHDRVAEQFARPAMTAATPRGLLRRAAVRALLLDRSRDPEAVA